MDHSQVALVWVLEGVEHRTGPHLLKKVVIPQEGLMNSVVTWTVHHYQQDSMDHSQVALVWVLEGVEHRTGPHLLKKVVEGGRQREGEKGREERCQREGETGREGEKAKGGDRKEERGSGEREEKEHKKNITRT